MNDSITNASAATEFDIAQIRAGIASLKESLYLQGVALAQEFHERRMELSEGFSNLNLVVRKRQNGSISMSWACFHFKGGRPSKAPTTLRKRRGNPHFDKGVIKLNSPEWLHDWALEVEDRLRPMREALDKLTEMERALRVVGNRLTGEPEQQEGVAEDEVEADEVMAHFTGAGA